jgi:predicted enzyme related to lactoylglutathione lyase
MMPLCHFDIPSNDFETVKKFYGGMFGWTFDQDANSLESWTNNFESDEQPRLVTGGVVPKSAPTQPIGCHFLVSSIDETSAKIRALGGVVFVSKTAVPEKGFYACCLDPENNYFVIWEDNEKVV